MNRFLVTGGGGFLGRYIVEQLRHRGCDVRVLARNRYPELENLGCECIQGDIRNTQVVSEACKGIDTVFHVAAVAGFWGKKRDFFSINVQGTENVVAGCLKHGVSSLVYTSSPSVVCAMKDLTGVDESQKYPKKFYAHYPESKAIAEKIVLAANKKSPLATCSLRPHLIWGPRDPHIIPLLLNRAHQGKLIQIGAGKNKVDFTYIENAAHAHILAGDRLKKDSPIAGKAYFISDGNPILLWEWVKQLLQAMEYPPVKKQISYRKAYILGTILESMYGILPFLGEPRITRFLAAQFATSHYFSIEKARCDLLYRPCISNDEALQKTVSWFKMQKRI